MSPLTQEWVEKAEKDYRSALRELRARKDPDYDDGCFHSQQCIEKYLKALLQESGIAFSKTHQLEKLIDLLVPDPMWLTIRPQLVPLNSYAVNFRYPGYSAEKAKLTVAMKACREVRNHARQILEL